MFRSMVYSALGVALVVGLFLSAVQTLAVSPIIHAAEVFEVAQPEVVAYRLHPLFIIMMRRLTL